MTASFVDDLKYLVKVLLFTFIILSFVVIYNNKTIEGIILITFCCQILLIWSLFEDFEPFEILGYMNKYSDSHKFNSYLYLLLPISLLITAIIFIFRAIVIAQYSFIIYGSIRSDLYFEIIFSASLGSMMFILFMLLSVYRKKNSDKAPTPQSN